IKLSESPSFGIPAIAHDAESRGSISYLNLAKEILVKNGLLKALFHRYSEFLVVATRVDVRHVCLKINSQRLFIAKIIPCLEMIASFKIETSCT
ncbi:MAG: hypothetical protein AAGA85_26665, partial [Bacteroidota bacterium]